MGSRAPARKSRMLGSIRDDDEMELCETKNGWAAGSHGTATRVRTVGVTDDGDSEGRSGTSSPYDPQQQRITVVHEYTVEHADAL
jgi:hypothetical protein